MTAFDRAWDVAKSQFLIGEGGREGYTSAGTSYNRPWTYKYRVPIGRDPETGELIYSERDREVVVGSDKGGSHYPASAVHLEHQTKPWQGLSPNTSFTAREEEEDDDPDKQDQLSMEDIISTIIHENIHDAWNYRPGTPSILQGTTGETAGRRTDAGSFGRTPHEEFPGVLAKPKKKEKYAKDSEDEAIGDSWHQRERLQTKGPGILSESGRPAPSMAKIGPGRGRKYDVSRLPNEKAAFIGEYPNLRGLNAYRAIIHPNVTIEDSNRILDNIIAARKRAGIPDRRIPGWENPKTPEHMRMRGKLARKLGRRFGGKGRKTSKGGRVEGMFDEAEESIDPETGEWIENPRKGLGISYLSEMEPGGQRGEVGQRFIVPAEEQILNNLLNAVRQSVHTRMANSGEFFERGDIPLSAEMDNWDVKEAFDESGMGGVHSVAQTYGGRDKAVAQETQKIRRLLNAHFKKVRDGREPVPQSMADLPPAIQEELGRIQLRQILGERRGTEGILDLEGVRDPLGETLMELNDMLETTIPGNLKDQVAYDTLENLEVKLQDELNALRERDIGSQYDEDGNYDPNYYGRREKWSNNMPTDAVRVWNKLRDIQEKMDNISGGGRGRPYTQGHRPAEFTQGEWESERERIMDAILEHSTGLRPARSRSQKHTYNVDNYGTFPNFIWEHFIEPELMRRVEAGEEMPEGIWNTDDYDLYTDYGDHTGFNLQSKANAPMVGVRGNVTPRIRPFGNLTDEVMAWFDKN